jgi:hypothetical protein
VLRTLIISTRRGERTRQMRITSQMKMTSGTMMMMMRMRGRALIRTGLSKRALMRKISTQ